MEKLLTLDLTSMRIVEVNLNGSEDVVMSKNTDGGLRFLPDLPALTGKVAIVTGGGDLAWSIAGQLCLAGARVMIANSSDDQTEQKVACLTGRGHQALHVETNARYLPQIESAVAYTLNEFGRVDFLVNITGASESMHLLDLTEEKWDCVLDAELKGFVFFSQAAARQMMQQGTGGHIINVMPEMSPAGSIHGAAARAGHVEVSQTLARELEPLGITVECVQVPAASKTDPDEVARRVAGLAIGGRDSTR